MRISALYTRLRKSKTYVWLIFGISTAWIFWNLAPGLPHFDDAGFERLTLILSIEASVYSSIIGAILEAQAATQRARDDQWRAEQRELLQCLKHLQLAALTALETQTKT